MRMSSKKLNRRGEHRVALIRNLMTALITNKSIVTTEAKVKALKPCIDRSITLSKRYLRAKDAFETATNNIKVEDGTDARQHLASLKGQAITKYRAVVSYLGSSSKASILFDIARQSADRKGGYTSTQRIRRRLQDGAVEMKISFMDHSNIQGPVVVGETSDKI